MAASGMGRCRSQNIGNRPHCSARAAPLSEISTVSSSAYPQTGCVRAASEAALHKSARCEAVLLEKQQKLRDFQRQCRRRVVQQRSSERRVHSTTAPHGQAAEKRFLAWKGQNDSISEPEPYAGGSGDVEDFRIIAPCIGPLSPDGAPGTILPTNSKLTDLIQAVSATRQVAMWRLGNPTSCASGQFALQQQQHRRSQQHQQNQQYEPAPGVQLLAPTVVASSSSSDVHTESTAKLPHVNVCAEKAQNPNAAHVSANHCAHREREEASESVEQQPLPSTPLRLSSMHCSGYDLGDRCQVQDAERPANNVENSTVETPSHILEDHDVGSEDNECGKSSHTHNAAIEGGQLLTASNSQVSIPIELHQDSMHPKADEEHGLTTVHQALRGDRPVSFHDGHPEVVGDFGEHDNPSSDQPIHNSLMQSSRCDSIIEGDSNTNAVSNEDGTSRYTSGLLSLLLRAYAKRNRPPPVICACVPQPTCPAPKMGSDGNLSQSPAWDTYLHKLASSSSHARNCEFMGNLSRLQKQVLVLIQNAKNL